jgi:electron transfer flavoprotein beta subunit
MKIAVALKQVPARDAVPGAPESDLQFEINEPDAYALEAALQLREAQGGEVVVISAGPPRVVTAIREALAKGADRGVHLRVDDPGQLDSLGVAHLLREAVLSEAPDLVLTGLQSDDLGSGQTGVILAELLGHAHATLIMAIEPQGAAVRVKRELEDGWFQHVTLPLPAVLTIQSGINKLRYATLMGIKKAKTKEIREIAGAPLPAQVAAGAGYSPSRSKQAQIFDGDPEKAARALAEKLKYEVRVL